MAQTPNSPRFYINVIEWLWDTWKYVRFSNYTDQVMPDEQWSEHFRTLPVSPTLFDSAIERYFNYPFYLNNPFEYLFLHR